MDDKNGDDCPETRGLIESFITTLYLLSLDQNLYRAIVRSGLQRERERKRKIQNNLLFFAKLCVYRVSLFHSFTIFVSWYIVCLCVQILRKRMISRRGKNRLFSLSSSAETRQSKISVFLFPLLCFFFFSFFSYNQD